MGERQMAEVKIKVLEDFSREAALRKKWIRTWEKLGERILKLPKWMQNIILEDVNTAVRNRIATMEMIHNAQRNH
jgi:hypothetical protein